MLEMEKINQTEPIAIDNRTEMRSSGMAFTSSPKMFVVGSVAKTIRHSLVTRWQVDIPHHYSTVEDLITYGRETLRQGEYQLVLIGADVDVARRTQIIKGIRQSNSYEAVILVLSHDPVYEGIQLPPTATPEMIAERFNLRPIVSPAQIIVVLSRKGGVGKSQIAINLAATLAKKGQKVVLIDDDRSTRSVRSRMGIGEDALSSANLAAELEAQTMPVNEAQIAKHLVLAHQVYTLPGPTDIFTRYELTPDVGRDVLAIMGSEMQVDFIVIDAPPDAINTSCFTYGILTAQHGTFVEPIFLIPVIPEKDLLRSVDDTLTTLTRYQYATNTAVPIVNCTQPTHEPEMLEGITWRDPIGVLPYCPAAQFVGETQRPLVVEEPENIFWRLFKRIILGHKSTYHYQLAFDQIANTLVGNRDHKKAVGE